MTTPLKPATLFAILAVLAVAALALFAADPRTADAGELCEDVKGEYCVSLTPDPDTNPVGTDHTVTAATTFNGQPVGEGDGVAF